MSLRSLSRRSTLHLLDILHVFGNDAREQVTSGLSDGLSCGNVSSSRLGSMDMRQAN
jgi:hypothetical protein